MASKEYAGWPKTLYRKNNALRAKDNPEGDECKTFASPEHFVTADGEQLVIGKDWFENPACKPEPPRRSNADILASELAKDDEIRKLRADNVVLQEELLATQAELNEANAALALATKSKGK